MTLERSEFGEPVFLPLSGQIQRVLLSAAVSSLSSEWRPFRCTGGCLSGCLWMYGWIIVHTNQNRYDSHKSAFTVHGLELSLGYLMSFLKQAAEMTGCLRWWWVTERAAEQDGAWVKAFQRWIWTLTSHNIPPLAHKLPGNQVNTSLTRAQCEITRVLLQSRLSLWRWTTHQNNKSRQMWKHLFLMTKRSIHIYFFHTIYNPLLLFGGCKTSPEVAENIMW